MGQENEAPINAETTVTPMQVEGSKTKGGGFIRGILLFLGLIIYTSVLLYAGFYIGENNLIKTVTIQNQLIDPASPIFANFKGELHGKILRIQLDKALIETSSGGQAIFTLPNTVQVNQIEGGQINPLGTGYRAVILDQNAIIKIATQGRGYAIYEINYFGNATLPTYINSASSSANTN